MPQSALFKSKDIARMAKKTPLLKYAVKGLYKIIMFPFTRNGIAVRLGGEAPYRLDYHFALRGYENLGRGHNTGFNKWPGYCAGKTAVFDIGAHIGLYTIPAAKNIAPGGTVYAFEPAEANRKYLKRHLKYNDIRNVRVLPYVIGEETREGQVFYEKGATDPMNSLRLKSGAGGYSKVYRRQVSLDDFVEGSNVRPELIKVDVEGAECNVLKGARRSILKYRPDIFLSVHPRQLALFDSSVDELKAIIDDLGYAFRDRGAGKAAALEHREYILGPV